ncbi:hypothetical protein PC39_14377 [Salinisphaera sp. PC39]|uniref:SCO family protein n=1 Tax=Salinisphaera sp. PC39 TaxID=1304156 RepID=UPI00334050E4
MIRHHASRFALAALLAAGLAACGNDPAWHGHDIRGVMPDLAFTLTDENGETANAADTAGHVRVLFFGYTHCPDICPVTLGRLSAALGELPEAQRDRVRVLFVSVDPERDGPEELAAYTDYYGPRFIGLTGTRDQLDEITKRYRVTYGYGEPDADGFYTVSHSSGIFVFGPGGEARLLINQSQSVPEIAADLERLLARTE